MKNIMFILLCALSVNADSQTVYLADTAFYTDIGYGGAAASCIASDCNSYGWGMDRESHVWLANEFTVPAGAMWIFDTVILYGYQIGSTTTSGFLNCNLQIYNGAPGLGGTVIWGDTTTNYLNSTGFTGIYRVSAGNLTDVQRPVMYLKLYLNTPPRLVAGTYWLSWSAAGVIHQDASPDKVLPGRINPSGQMARQLTGGSWNYITENGNEVGMNMIIEASASVGIPNIANNEFVRLNQNIPNPFSEFTVVSFNLPRAGYAKLSVYNTVGQLVATPFDGDTNAGEHQVTFNADMLPPGVYYYQLNTDAGFASRQMLLVR
jgi:type IX secretion system substrate protein